MFLFVFKLLIVAQAMADILPLMFQTEHIKSNKYFIFQSFSVQC